MREAYALAFEGMGGVEALVRWGKRNPARFYPLAARLIPHDTARPLVDLPTRVEWVVIDPAEQPKNSQTAEGAGVS
jgi:hypothetical protein